MKIKKDWWKDFFNEIYLLTDARSVCDVALTSREVDLLEEILQLDKDDEILDLCGGYGRHSLELARRGHRHLTVLDFSSYLIKLGRKLSRQANVKIKFLCGDARFSGLKSGVYSVIFIMANSFGYFAQQRENLRMLKEVYRLLKGGGRILLDLADSDYVRRNLKPFSWHRASEDIMVYRQRELCGDLLKARELVVSRSRGLLRDGFYCERIYTQEKITRLLKAAGFKDMAIKRNLSLHQKRKDYGLLTSRMFVTARKGSSLLPGGRL